MTRLKYSTKRYPVLLSNCLRCIDMTLLFHTVLYRDSPCCRPTETTGGVGDFSLGRLTSTYAVTQIPNNEIAALCLAKATGFRAEKMMGSKE